MNGKIALVCWASLALAGSAALGQDISSSAGDLRVEVSREDGSVSATWTGGAVFQGAFLEGEGWATPGPATRTGEEFSAHPISGNREVELSLRELDSLPVVLFTSRLRRLDQAAGEYYFWQSNLSFDHYFVPGPDGPRRVECDIDEWDTIEWAPWVYLPVAEPGLVLFPTNDMGRTPGEGGALFMHALPKNKLLEPGDTMDTTVGIALADSPDAAQALWQSIAEDVPPGLAPWLDPPLPASLRETRAAPEWLLEAEIANGYYRSAADWTDDVVTQRLKGFPFIIGSTPDVAALERCHAADVRLLHYVVYTCLLDTEMQVAEGGSVYSEWSESVDNETRDLASHPDWVCLKEDGGKQHDAWGLDHGHPGLLNTCLHQQELHDAAARQVDILMDRGFDGVFVDLAGPTVECYGPEFGAHEHPDGAEGNTAAYDRLLAQVYESAKAQGDDRIVVHNPVTGLIPSHWAFADAQMLETFPFGDGSTAPRPTWPELRLAGAMGAQALEHGKRVIILPYLSGISAEEAVEPALLTFAYARLFGLLPADYFTLRDIPGAEEFAPELYSTRLGRATSGVIEADGVLSRTFEQGSVAVNTNPWDAIWRPESDKGGGGRLLGLGEAPKDMAIPLPAHSGRVLIAEDMP